MTLHEAIQQVLKEKASPLSASEIAKVLNENGLYRKGDGSLIKGGQISARVNNYPHLLNKLNCIVSQRSVTGIPAIKKRKTIRNSIFVKTNDKTSILMETLMKPKSFKAIPKVENKVPDRPGLYCMRIVDPTSLIPLFADVLRQRNHNIIYIGLASKSLKKRFLGQELRAKGHGTFFRSLGAVLGFTPEKGSLVGKKNQKNYKFSYKDQAAIIDSINENFIVNWVEVDGNIDAIENELLKTYLPLLNLAGNPG
ncbi:GIY-YIG nuclease family protein [Flavobacterium sp. ASW18X]|uniref:GIY-YIG nuclease family protein n=1 Tax=Flavobacterium sp. ASW18X TaxID=2572595 RepID=UPI0010AE6FE8|nr:HTH domain-containing protein [Flavobacterium sp. ASW18X]TKD66534.1 hypothetical protein FBT53_01370 [Flavobacterium sp. ASW18X]